MKQIQLIELSHETQLEVVTILLIFLVVVLYELFLIAILIIFMRKIKDLLQSQAKPYFYVILLYIVSKLVIGIVIQMKVVSGIATNWNDLTGQFIETCFKDSLIVGDLCLIELFLISFELYMSICFSFLELGHIGQIWRLILKVMQIAVFVVYAVSLGLFNFDVISYQVNNAMGAGLNCLSVLAFLVSFFYLNFKMTGIMIEVSLNESMKKIYKVILMLLFSRTIYGVSQIMISVLISDGSFSGFINTIIEKQGEIFTEGVLFIGFILFTLLTEGIPIMMSLRTSVVMAFNATYDKDIIDRESIITTYTSALKERLIDQESIMDNDFDLQIQLKTFKIVEEIKNQAIQKVMKARIGERFYILRQINADISNYIIEDIQNEIKEVDEYQIKPLNRTSFFCQNNAIYIYQRFRVGTLDSLIQKANSIEDQIKLALKIAVAIQAFHRNEIAHGCLNKNNIAFDANENVYFLGFGLESLRKYLSLTTDYTNKTFYTAVQLLNDRNKVILRPKKTADIYSFGIVFYEIVTKNMNYRTLELKEVKIKFGTQNFRPKIPEHIDGNIKNLMRKCWQQDPMDRPNIKYIIEFLKRLIR